MSPGRGAAGWAGCEICGSKEAHDATHDTLKAGALVPMPDATRRLVARNLQRILVELRAKHPARAGEFDAEIARLERLIAAAERT